MRIKSVVIFAMLLWSATRCCNAQPPVPMSLPGLHGRTYGITPPGQDFSISGPVRQDFTGKLYRYVDDAGNVVLGPVDVNAYGYGVHRDQYGRAVRAVPLDGKADTILQPQ